MRSKVGESNSSSTSTDFASRAARQLTVRRTTWLALRLIGGQQLADGYAQRLRQFFQRVERRTLRFVHNSREPAAAHPGHIGKSIHAKTLASRHFPYLSDQRVVDVFHLDKFMPVQLSSRSDFRTLGAQCIRNLRQIKRRQSLRHAEAESAAEGQ